MAEITDAERPVIGSGLLFDGTTLSNQMVLDLSGADPRSGAGKAGPQGAFGWDGTYWYQKVGAGDNDWKKLFRQTIEVTGAAVTDVTFTGLDGDLDGGYRVRYWIKNADSTPAVFRVEPNGLTTDQVARRTYDGGGTDTWSYLTLAGTGALDTNQVLAGEFVLQSRTGRRRTLSNHAQIDSADITILDTVGWWREDSTNITSLKITGKNGSTPALAVGCIFELEIMGLVNF